jgi:hypothetical protein
MLVRSHPIRSRSELHADVRVVTPCKRAASASMTGWCQWPVTILFQPVLSENSNEVYFMRLRDSRRGAGHRLLTDALLVHFLEAG